MAIAEEELTRARVGPDQPTRLSLFRFSGDTLRNARVQVAAASRFSREFDGIDDLYTHVFDNQIHGLGEQVKAQKESLSGQRKQISERITASAAYAQILNEIISRGGSNQEAFAFFQKAFIVNCLLNSPATPTTFTELLRTRKAEALGDLAVGPLARKFGLDSVFRNVLDNPPACFTTKGFGMEDWRFWAVKHVYFSRLFQYNRNDPPTTSLENKPVWFKEAEESGQAPDDDIVKAEWDKDEHELEVIGQALKCRTLEFNDLVGLNKQALLKTIAAIEEGRRQAFPAPIDSFLNLVIFLEATGEYHPIPLDPQTILKLKAEGDQLVEELERRKIHPDRNRRNHIQEFAERQETTPSPEILALYLEKILTRAQVIDTVTAPLADNHIGMLSNLLDVMEGSNSFATGIWAVLKEHYPAQHQVLDQQIRALLMILPTQNRRDLSSLVEARAGKPFEELVWDISDKASEQFAKKGVKIMPATREVLKELRGFTADWMDKNAAWANQRLVEQLTSSAEGEVDVPLPPSDIAEQIVWLQEQIRQLQTPN